MGDERQNRNKSEFGSAATQFQESAPDLGSSGGVAVSEPQSAEAIAVGDVIDQKYEIQQVLGEGAMGIVYKARDSRLERDVAMKVIRSDWAAHEKVQSIFLSEARAMASVHHPNVVDIYDFGWTGNSPYFVMEFIEGTDLEAWLKRRGMLAVDEALGVLDRICRGVAAIHHSGAIHRDLKPSNVMIGKGFRVAVADLGLAEVLNAAGGEGSWVGSPGFIAPEMIRREQLDPNMLARLDIYALGAIAYELFTNTPAFDGDSAEAVLLSQAEGEFTPLSEIRPELPVAFDGVISKSMALDPKSRYATVDEFKRELYAARHAVVARRKARRIAVIDDKRADLELAIKILKGRFNEAVLMPFEDPTQALTAIAADPPSLIICDLRMDTMDGLRVVQAIRSAAEFNHVPIIMMSAEGSGRDWRELKQAGADGYLMKPLDPVTLGALAESLLESPMRIRGAPKA